MSSLQMSEVPETSYWVKGLSDSITVPMMIDVIGLKRANEIAEETIIFKDSLRALPESIRRHFIKNTEAMQLDDKVAILGEIELMMEDGVSEEEVMEYINELEVYLRSLRLDLDLDPPFFFCYWLYAQKINEVRYIAAFLVAIYDITTNTIHYC